MIKYKWHALLSDSTYLINYDPKCFYRNKTPEKPVKTNAGKERQNRKQYFFHIYNFSEKKNSGLSYQKKEPKKYITFYKCFV